MKSTAILLSLVLSTPLLATSAETVLDPTRPPPAWLAAQETGNKAGKAEATDTPQQPVQLVLSGPTRRFAIVRGEFVGSGNDPNAPRLVELKRDEMTIETKEGKETLSIHPGVEITPITPRARPAPNKDKK